MKRLALVLTGGGARAAYQAGAIRALAELWPHKQSPFQIITGLSAGSINACLLAHYSDDFQGGAERLWMLWNTLTIDKVFHSNSLSVAHNSLSVLRGLLVGGMPSPESSHLLNNAPLRVLIERNVDFGRVHDHVQSGRLRAFAVTATNYATGCAVTFFDAEPGREEWVRNNHLGMSQPLSTSHILASSAIPIFFPPTLVSGAYYGDGTLRLLSPLSPSLHMGATALMTIGVRKRPDPARLKEQNQRPGRKISFADVAGVVLNAMFLDTLDSDLDRLRRFNHSLHGMDARAREILQQDWRIIDEESLQPSRDLGASASGQSERYPWALRHLLRGMGVRKRSGSDLSSYVAFDYRYTGKLLRIGYNDVMDKRDSLRHFMLTHADI
ncbi:MAG: patatin-like phospholipase family protein [bacterium]